MIKLTTKISLLCVGVFLCTVVAREKPSAELFPVPEAIKHNIEFWKKIYAVYPSNKVLIHDTRDLSIIYEVVDFHGFEDNHSYRREWRGIDRIQDEYAKILRGLARHTIDFDYPSARLARVLEIYGTNADAKKLESAAKSIRAQLGMKDKFRLGLQRSGLYREAIAAIFAKYGLPQELIMLPHVESSFNYQAYSKVGAAGIWQFTRHTGRLFMKINYDVDERLDPIRSTEAAAKLLKLNYEVLQSWPLAITAYNHGLNGMKRARAKYGSDFNKIYHQYTSRSFGFASRNFYAEFLAALEVAQNYRQYFGEVEFHSPAEFVEIELDHYVTVKSVLKSYGVDFDEFALLNPALRPPVLKSRRRIPRGYALRLPRKIGDDPRLLAEKIAPNQRFDTQVRSDWYRVRRGDNLSAIARRFKVSIAALVAHNNLRNAALIRAGTILKIPREGTTRLASAARAQPATPKAEETQAPVVAKAVVKPSPSRIVLAPVPQTAGGASDDKQAEVIPREEREAIVTYDLEPAESRLVSFASTRPVMVPPVLPSPALQLEAVSEWITVEPEETLGHYAEWLEVPTQRLRRINGLRYNQDIHIGQRIRLTYQNVSAAEFQRRRYEYQRSIEEDFFSTYQVDTLQTHRIRRGETIWEICNDIYELPVWLVAKYNPDRDLSQLHLGDELSIPMVVAVNPSSTPSVQE